MYRKFYTAFGMLITFFAIMLHYTARPIPFKLTPTKKIELLDMMGRPDWKEIETRNKNHAMENAFQIYSSEVKPFEGLEMANVPVLDQGQYGTCVTFAATAALDARFILGDLISQQCSLQLNVSLGNDLWDGAYYPSEVIDPLKKYGVVSQTGCNASYPARSTKISVEEYKKRADIRASDIVSNVQYSYYSQNNLSALKSAISSGKRVLIAFLLNPNSKDGVKGYDISINGVKKYGGLWACSSPDVAPQPEPSPLEKCMQDFPGYEWWCQWVYGKQSISAAKENCGSFQAGHEVIATGYDDSQKLIKIRNSWGTTVGDSGEYYMTYEFFASQVMDMTVVE